MRALPIVLLALSAQVSGAAGPSGEAVDPNLWAAASTGGFRALVFRECSPEHCWTRLLVQAGTPGATLTKFQCTSEVRELGYGSFISDISWRPPADAKLSGATLVVRVSPSHGGVEPHEATIAVSDDCAYKFASAPPA